MESTLEHPASTAEDPPPVDRRRSYATKDEIESKVVQDLGVGDSGIDDDDDGMMAFEDAVEGGEEEARMGAGGGGKSSGRKSSSGGKQQQPLSALGSLFRPVSLDSNEDPPFPARSSSPLSRSTDRDRDRDEAADRRDEVVTRGRGISVVQPLRFEDFDAEGQQDNGYDDDLLSGNVTLSPEERERMLRAFQLLEAMSSAPPTPTDMPPPGPEADAETLPRASDVEANAEQSSDGTKGSKRFLGSMFNRIFKSSKTAADDASGDQSVDASSSQKLGEGSSAFGDDASSRSGGVAGTETPGNASASSAGSNRGAGTATAAGGIPSATGAAKAGAQKTSTRPGQTRGAAPTKRPNTVPVVFSGRKSAQREYVGLQLCQSFVAHAGTCWCIKLSVDGKYLASSGQDGVVHIWEVMRGFNVDTHRQVDRKGSVSMARKSTDSEDQDDEQVSPLLLDGAGDKLSLPRGPIQGKSKLPGWEGIAEGGSQQDDVDACEWTLAQIIDATAPLQSFNDHANDVIDVSWSATNFLLSASIDGSVHLYHVSKSECLLICRHPDIVSSVAFHPTRDRYFITGCVDRKIRCWDVSPTLHVSSWAQTPDVISTVSYNSSGTMAAAGLINGHVYLYKTEGMKYYTLLECRNSSGKYRRGSRVNSIAFVEKTAAAASRLSFRLSRDGTTSGATPRTNDTMGSRPQAGMGGPGANSTARLTTNLENSQLLVSTNDSRIRMFKMSDFSLGSKFKGHASFELPIRASMSEDGAYLISGSEDGYVYMWDHARMQAAPVTGASQGEDADEGAEKQAQANTSSHFPKLQGTQRNAQYDYFFNEVFFSQGADGALSGELLSGAARPTPAATNRSSETPLDGNGKQQSKNDTNTAAPVISAVFGSSAMIRNALSTTQIRRLMHRQRTGGALRVGDSSSIEGFPTVPSTLSDPKPSQRRSAKSPMRPKSSGSSSTSSVPPPPQSTEDRRIQRYISDLSRRIIITADYNGVIRVYTHGF